MSWWMVAFTLCSNLAEGNSNSEAGVDILVDTHTFINTFFNEREINHLDN
jgi:hypothetical protein